MSETPLILVGFAGRAGAGKDTAAQALSRFFHFKVRHFADSLKMASIELFDFSDQQLHTQAGKETVDAYWGFSPRYALQKLGTECMRDMFGNDFWVRRAFKRVMTGRVVFADVRFPEEAEAIRSAGGKVIRIVRPGSDLSDATQLHASETSLRDWSFDAEIENSADIQLFRGEVIETTLEFFPELQP